MAGDSASASAFLIVDCGSTRTSMANATRCDDIISVALLAPTSGEGPKPHPCEITLTLRGIQSMLTLIQRLKLPPDAGEMPGQMMDRLVEEFDIDSLVVDAASSFGTPEGSVTWHCCAQKQVPTGTGIPLEGWSGDYSYCSDWGQQLYRRFTGRTRTVEAYDLAYHNAYFNVHLPIGLALPLHFFHQFYRRFKFAGSSIDVQRVLRGVQIMAIVSPNHSDRGEGESVVSRDCVADEASGRPWVMTACRTC